MSRGLATFGRHSGHILPAFCSMLLLSMLLLSVLLLGVQLDGGVQALAASSDTLVATTCFATSDDGGTVFSSSDGQAAQAAVDAAGPGDTVKLAGVCSGVSARAGVTQTIYVSQALTLRGGYTTTNWATSDPAAHPTRIDAQGLGRAIYVTGTMPVTLVMLTVTGGAAAGDSDTCAGMSCGAGIYAYAPLSLAGVEVMSNTATREGGGVYALGPLTVTTSTFGNNQGYSGGATSTATDRTTVLDSRFTSNHAVNFGGAIHTEGQLELHDSDVLSNTGFIGGGVFAREHATIHRSTMRGNSAAVHAGGVFAYGTAAISGTSFIENEAVDRAGGGIFANGVLTVTDSSFVDNRSPGTFTASGGAIFSAQRATVRGSTFRDNRAAEFGGGVLAQTGLTLEQSHFLGNRSEISGGALALFGSDEVEYRVVNVLFAGNRAVETGNAIYATHRDEAGGTVEILHTTIASPTVAAGTAVSIDSGTARIRNTIVTSQSVGIAGHEAVFQDYNFFFGVTTPVSGTVDGGDHTVTGPPAFVDPGADEYHLAAGSAAIDAGADLGVTTDIDGDVRPQGRAPDVGFDETVPLHLYLPLVIRPAGVTP